MAKDEEWRRIPGTSNFYVSNQGNVREGSILLRITKTQEGYCRCGKVINGDRYVHRMAAKAYLPPPKPGQIYVNHKNGKKDDNRPSNLEWVTSRENSMLAGINKQVHGGNGKTFVTVTSKEGISKTFESQKEASEYIGAHNSAINKAIRGLRKTCNGFKCHYSTQEEINEYIRANGGD